MPFLVPLEIKSSSIHGLGIFALQKIPKDTIVWIGTYNHPSIIPIRNLQTQTLNFTYTEEQFKNLMHIFSRQEIIECLIYGQAHKKSLKLCIQGDGGQYTNHSKLGNTRGLSMSDNWEQDITIAVRDIEKGEQITQNYNAYMNKEVNWIYDLMKEYCGSIQDYIQE